LNLTVTQCRRKQIAHWLIGTHYARRLPSVSFGFNLTLGGVDAGALTIGKPASPWIGRGVCGGRHEDRVYELNRLVVADWAPKNTASRFIAEAFSMLSAHGDFIVVSYADTGWGHTGYVYQATNFLYTGCSKPRTDVDPGPGKHSRHYEPTDEARAKRKFRSPKHRYVIFVGPNRRKLRRELAYPVLPYPKAPSLRYDTINPVPAMPELRESKPPTGAGG